MTEFGCFGFRVLALMLAHCSFMLLVTAVLFPEVTSQNICCKKAYGTKECMSVTCALLFTNNPTMLTQFNRCQKSFLKKALVLVSDDAR